MYDHIRKPEIAAALEWAQRGKLRETGPGLSKFLVGWGGVVVAFEIWAIFSGGLDPYIHSAVFFGIMTPPGLMLYKPRKSSREQIHVIDILLCVFTVAASMYIWWDAERFLYERWPQVDSLLLLDWVFGVILVLVAIEVTRRLLGLGITTVVLVLIAYSLFGHVLPGQFYHRPLPLEEFIDQMVYTVNGIFGFTTYVAATYVFMFVTFGVFLDKANGGDFFSKIANAIVGHQSEGASKGCCQGWEMERLPKG